jgi:hypothetical protein
LFQYDTRVLEREWQANKRPGYDSKWSPDGRHDSLCWWNIFPKCLAGRLDHPPINSMMQNYWEGI